MAEYLDHFHVCYHSGIAGKMGGGKADAGISLLLHLRIQNELAFSIQYSIVLQLLSLTVILMLINKKDSID